MKLGAAAAPPATAAPAKAGAEEALVDDSAPF
jgi:hypothetical protein